MNGLTFFILYMISVIVTFVAILYFEIYFEKDSKKTFLDGKNAWNYYGIKTFKDIKEHIPWVFIPCYLCLLPIFNVLWTLGYVIKWLLKKTKITDWIDNIKV